MYAHEPTAAATEKFDWASTTPRERDVWIARHVWDWHSIDHHVYDGWGGKMPGQTGPHAHSIPAFTADIRLAFETQAKVAARVGWSRYAQTLWRLMFAAEDFSWEKVWGVANASAEQRCRAAYLALTA